MKRLAGILCLFGLSLFQGMAAGKPPLGEVDTTWPGVSFQIFRVERIPGDRLLFGVRIIAAASAPASGTLIGVKVAPPKDASTEDIQSGRFEPQAFSLKDSKMIEEKTRVEYAALAPRAEGPQYIPGEILATLMPGRSEIVTVQFAAPPPPVKEPGAPVSEKQKVSLVLPNAKEPVTIPLPEN